VSCRFHLDGLATTRNYKRDSVQPTTARIRADVGRRQLEYRCPLRMRMRMIVVISPLASSYSMVVVTMCRVGRYEGTVWYGSRSSRSCGLQGELPAPLSIVGGWGEDIVLREQVCAEQYMYSLPSKGRHIHALCPALLRSVLPRPAPPRWSKAPSEASLRQPEARRQHQSAQLAFPFRLPPLFPRQSSKLPHPFQLIDELDRPPSPSPSPSPSPFWPSTDPLPSILPFSSFVRLLIFALPHPHRAKQQYIISTSDARVLRCQSPFQRLCGALKPTPRYRI
jgi:hypothetical protein